MRPARIKHILMATAIAFLCSMAKASTKSPAEILQNDDLWSLFQERQNLRFIMKEARNAPYSDLIGLMPLKLAKDDVHLQIINKSLLAFPRPDFNPELLLQIKKYPDAEVQDFFFSFFADKFETEKRKHESTLLDLVLSDQKQCLILHRKSVSASDLNFFNQAGISHYPLLNYRLLGRGFCFEILSDVLQETLKKNWNPRQKQILEMTFETLSQNEIFIRFFNKPGVVGVYTPGDNVISISTPSQFDLSTLVHETAHANFNIFFHELFTFMQKNKFSLPPEFLSEPDEELISVTNLERSPFLNLLNEFQAWKYEGLMSDSPEDNNKLVNIILSYYGSGMKKEVHDLFTRDWANLQSPEEIRRKIKQRILDYNHSPKEKPKPTAKDSVKIAKKIEAESKSDSDLSIIEIIQSLADLNSNFSENLQALEKYFDAANIRQLPREATTDAKALVLLSEFDSDLSHFLASQKNIYHLKDLTYFLSKKVLPIELPKTFILLTQALQSQEETPSAKLVRISFFPDPYGAKTNIEWPMALIAAVDPSSVAAQYQEVIANFLRIGAGVYLTPFLENGANELSEMRDCSAAGPLLRDIPKNKLKIYKTSVTYLKFFLEKGSDKTRTAAKYAIKSEPAFYCRGN